MTVDRMDILINRVVDREASDADWTELESLAQRDESVWRRLAEAQREYATLCAGLESAVAVADTVELPRASLDATHHFSVRWLTWGGWAVAATLLIGWATAQGLLPAAQPVGNQAELLPAGYSSEQAFDRYMTRGLEEGRVLAELPTVMVDAQRAEDDPQSTYITVMRRVIERTRVRGAYSVGVDELGQLRLVPADPASIDGLPGGGQFRPAGGDQR